MSDEKLDSLHQKIDELLECQKALESRKIPVSRLSVSLVGALSALLVLGTPTAAVIANHYKIQEHLENKRVHAEERRAEQLGGVAYSGDLAQKERQVYFALRALHCGVVSSANATICSSAYPDGPFPSFQAVTVK